MELLRQVRDDEPQPPRQLVRDIPPDLERACLKALAKHQQDRYTTAGDFAEDLQRVIDADADRSHDSASRRALRRRPLRIAAARIDARRAFDGHTSTPLRCGAPVRPSAAS